MGMAAGAGVTVLGLLTVTPALGLIAFLLALFVVGQGWFDADDPSLAHAPVDDDLHGFT
jgi:hypothetical protein